MMAITSFSGEYDFLSNFYKLPFVWEGNSAATAEHHYQAAKTIKPLEAFEVRTASTPGKAKRLGKTVNRRPNWDGVRIEVMRSILKAKFENPILLRQLLLTRDEPLVEGNNWGDTFWGQCPIGNGHNWLGRCLMDLRDAIRTS